MLTRTNVSNPACFHGFTMTPCRNRPSAKSAGFPAQIEKEKVAFRWCYLPAVTEKKCFHALAFAYCQYNHALQVLPVRAP